MAALILLALVATANALQLRNTWPGSELETGLEPEVAQPVVMEAGLKCPKKTDDLSWGVFMDGRDAGKGKYAYGHDYHDGVSQTLGSVYKMVPKNDTSSLKVSTFVKIGKLLGQELLPKQRTASVWLVKHCSHDALPEDFHKEVMQDIEAVDAETLHVKHPSKSMRDNLQPVFKSYNSQMQSASNKDQKLGALAFLVRNLAFLHPLPGSNGRSRTMLMQHEMRRHGIACGTFMYNNNKDIYFETQGTYVQKMQDGIDMYNQAYESGSNPWKHESKREEHKIKFSNEHDKKLKKCWELHCPPGRDGHKGCEGTSPSLAELTAN